MGRLLIAVAVLLALFATTAAAQGLDLDHVKELRDKGREHFDASANVDLAFKKRNEHRKESFTFLTEAFEILDKWCEENPRDGERLEDLMVEIHQMRYWLRKESPVGLLEKDDSNVRKGTPPGWPEKPPEDLHEPELPPDEKEQPGGGAPRPVKPAQPVAPAVDPLKANMDYAREWQRDHPYDIAGIRDLYLEILTHAVTGSAEYIFAMKRVSELNGKLKEAYRLLRNEDPDTLDIDGPFERSLVKSLKDDLMKGKEADVRLRAAEYLGMLRSGEAARHLVARAKREKEAAVMEQIFLALEQIGGVKVTAEIEKLKKVRKEQVQLRAVRVLESLVGRNDVEARYASQVLGVFIYSKYDSVADTAVDTLIGLGSGGIRGLQNAAGIKNYERKIRVIRALGDTGDGRAAQVLGGFLIVGAKGQLRQIRNAAEAALKKIGKPVVPYLAPWLGSPRIDTYARYVLYQITGVSFKTKERAFRWWKLNGGD